MATVNLCTIATRRYVQFLPPLLESVRLNFCAEHTVTCHVWTDMPFAYPNVHIINHHVDHEPWPGVTLHRFGTMYAERESLLATGEFTYHIDADALVVRPVGEEMFGRLVAVRHPGYVNAQLRELPYEQRPESMCWVHWKRGYRYYCGMISGGETPAYLELIRELADRIRIDEGRGIIPLWHDESASNRVWAATQPLDSCLDGRPLELSTDYCTPEGKETAASRIIALNKNHAAIRSEQ